MAKKSDKDRVKTGAPKVFGRKLADIRKLAREFQKNARGTGIDDSYQRALDAAAVHHGFQSWWHAKQELSQPVGKGSEKRGQGKNTVDLASLKSSLAKATRLVMSDDFLPDGDGLKLLPITALPIMTAAQFSELSDFVTSIDELLSLERFQTYNEETDKVEVLLDKALLYFSPREFDVFVVRDWKKKGLRTCRVSRSGSPDDFGASEYVEVAGIGTLELEKDFFYRKADAEAALRRMMNRAQQRVKRLETIIGEAAGS